MATAPVGERVLLDWSGGQPGDSMLGATRDMAAAQRFFRGADSLTDTPPQQVKADGQGSYSRAGREVLGHNVEHPRRAYLNGRIEQDFVARAEAPHFVGDKWHRMRSF
jgi:transposase-like protein